MGFCKNPLCHTVADQSYRRRPGFPLVIPLRTFSYVSFRGLTPESRSVMSHLVRAYCHSCAGRNRGHTVRANAATPEQSYFLLLWTKIGRLRNTEITGAGWSPLSHRDIFICTMTWIPGSSPGMTKAVVCFLFCEYCLCFDCGPGSPLGSRGGTQCRDIFYMLARFSAAAVSDFDISSILPDVALLFSPQLSVISTRRHGA
mgnify:CR=1 FL=1